VTGTRSARTGAVDLRVSTNEQTPDKPEARVRAARPCPRARGRGHLRGSDQRGETATAVRRHDARGASGRFEVLVIWALDRFGRSIAGNLADVLELDRIGVQVVSVRET
jgi:DNA invertase Pin-like site-specific DNA recombinase